MRSRQCLRVSQPVGLFTLFLVLSLSASSTSLAADLPATITGTAPPPTGSVMGSCLEPIVGMATTITLSWTQSSAITDSNAHPQAGEYIHPGSPEDPWITGMIQPGAIELLCAIGYIEIQNDLFNSDYYAVSGQQCTCSGDPLTTALISLRNGSETALDSDALPEPIPALEEFDAQRLVVLEGCLDAGACLQVETFRYVFDIDTLTVPEPAPATLGATALSLLTLLRRRSILRLARGYG